MKKLFVEVLALGLLILAALTPAGAWADSTFTLPASLKVIEEEAFANLNVNTVILPEGLERIESRAFAGSTVYSVNLPASLTYIADDALEGATVANITAPDNTYAHEWMEEQGFILREVSGVDYDYTIYNRAVTITKYKGNATDVVIPDSMDGFPVRGIGEDAFSYCWDMTNVTIPNSVVSIGRDAFYRCFKLTGITIPNGVTSIEAAAFEDCISLTSMTIPNGVTSIGWAAFKGCISLTSVTIPNSVTRIDNEAFRGCPFLTNVTIPDSVTIIGDQAFESCHGITSLTIPGSVISIGDKAFYNCGPAKKVYNVEASLDGLTSVTIESGVTSIGDEAFYGCKGLTNVSIPNTVTSIGSSAFNNCIVLQEVTIPGSVTSIGDRAFYRCNGLTSVKIENGVTRIGKEAFYQCKSLSNVTIPGSVKSIGSYSFYECRALTGATLEKGIKSIGEWAFDWCPLTSLTIPGSVISIGKGAFSTCALTSLTIENGVKIIGDYAFSTNRSLPSVTIPGSVISMGRLAFGNCDQLMSATCPKNLKEYSNEDEIKQTVFGRCPDGLAITFFDNEMALAMPDIEITANGYGASVGAGIAELDLTVTIKKPNGIDDSLVAKLDNPYVFVYWVSTDISAEFETEDGTRIDARQSGSANVPLTALSGIYGTTTVKCIFTYLPGNTCLQQVEIGVGSDAGVALSKEKYTVRFIGSLQPKVTCTLDNDQVISHNTTRLNLTLKVDKPENWTQENQNNVEMLEDVYVELKMDSIGLVKNHNDDIQWSLQSVSGGNGTSTIVHANQNPDNQSLYTFHFPVLSNAYGSVTISCDFVYDYSADTDDIFDTETIEIAVKWKAQDEAQTENRIIKFGTKLLGLNEADFRQTYYEHMKTSLNANTNPMRDPVIDSILFEEIMKLAKNQSEETYRNFSIFSDNLLETLKKADDTYVKIYLCTFYEYDIVIADFFNPQNSENTQSSNYNSKTNLCTYYLFGGGVTNTNIGLWMHEAAHAADFLSSRSKKTYKTLLEMSAIKEALEQDVDTLLGNYMTDYRRQHSEITNTEATAILNAIKAPGNKGTQYENGTFNVQEDPSINNNYRSDYQDYVISACMRLRATEGFVAENSANWQALMVSDIVGGITNNAVHAGPGHTDTYYWYDALGNYKGSQGQEGWAEYFASVMTASISDAKTINEQVFPETTNYFNDTLAPAILNACIAIIMSK